jgi:hypothetical protein
VYLDGSGPPAEFVTELLTSSVAAGCLSNIWLAPAEVIFKLTPTSFFNMVLTLKSKKYLGGDVFGLQVLGK